MLLHIAGGDRRASNAALQQELSSSDTIAITVTDIT